MEIVLPEELLNRLLPLDWAWVRQAIWVYSLGDPPWYVGTTSNPIARLTEHRRNTTKDTRGKLSSTTKMTLHDVVAPQDRYKAEAAYIAALGAENSNRMEGLFTPRRDPPRSAGKYLAETGIGLIPSGLARQQETTMSDKYVHGCVTRFDYGYGLTAFNIYLDDDGSVQLRLNKAEMCYVLDELSDPDCCHNLHGKPPGIETIAYWEYEELPPDLMLYRDDFFCVRLPNRYGKDLIAAIKHTLGYCQAQIKCFPHQTKTRSDAEYDAYDNSWIEELKKEVIPVKPHKAPPWLEYRPDTGPEVKAITADEFLDELTK